MTNWKRICRGLIQVLSRHLPGGPEENQRHETEIQTGNFPNTNRTEAKSRQYANLFRDIILINGQNKK